VRVISFLAVWILVAPGMAAEPAAPPPPERYDVRLRYRIDAFPKERQEQFDELLQHFKDVGFDKDPGPEDEATNAKWTRMTGSIAAANARKLLKDRHVQTLLLLPAGGKLPEGDAPIRVQFELAGGFNPKGQQRLADQVREALTPLGFKEAAAYETRGNRRLVGAIAASKLDALLEDLRRLPGADKLGAPFADRSPLAVVEVMLGMESPKERPPLPEPPKGQEKITPELRKLLPADKGEAKVERMEVILSAAPGYGDREWIRTLTRAAPELVIEGRVGPLVTVVGPVTLGKALAASPAVSTVRLPVSGEPRLTENVEEKLDAKLLQTLGRKSKKLRLAILDGDFAGWEGLDADKRLPAGTRMVDLTGARNSDLQPDPPVGDAKSLGLGARRALAAAAAAPEAQITLIRVDPRSPYQVLEVARYIAGEPVISENLDRRSEELIDHRRELDDRQEAMIAKEEAAYKSLPGEDDELHKKRLDAFKKEKAQLARDEKAYRDTMDRYLAMRRDLAGLKGIQAVASSLAWSEGQPLNDGPFSRYFDEEAFKPALWLTLVPDTSGQVWTGLFRDADANGVMEFVAPDRPLPKDRWTSELNFLAWQPVKGERTADLPAKTRVRVSIQWQEPHDPDVTRHDPESYRAPLAPLRLVVLRQRDPSGKTLPADDFEVIAQSSGLPQRLESRLNSAVYEQTLEFEAPMAGRYALRIEGQVPSSIRPANAPTLPAQRTTWELRPRVFLATLDGGGKVIFQDFTTDEAPAAAPKP
jgi:hypothetical protein